MKATHYGRCQLCDRQQKLPREKMAKHGYTTRFHFFEGTCPGSDELPYELSCALLPNRRDWAAATAKALLKQAAAERALRDPKCAWVHHYIPYDKSPTHRSQYKWMQVELVMKHRLSYYIEGQEHQAACYGLNGFGTDQYLPNCAAELNARKAQVTEASAKQHSDYAKWADARIKAWKKTALRPVAKELLQKRLMRSH